MENIILIWMPGSWKTTIWKQLAEKLNMNFLDFDDDIIEKQSWKTVAQLLEELGEEKFLDYEEQLVLSLDDIKNTILSTSWSVPLKENAMKKLKQLWKVIYLDIPLDIIKSRLKVMKVDRIVGMKNMTMDEILEYRRSFYEKSYDYKFTISENLSKEEVFELFYEFIKKI